MTQEIIRQLLPARTADSNKGTYGKLLNVSGSRECAGCAILSSLAAMRSGLGMVKVISDSGNFAPLMNIVPEALFSSDTGYTAVMDSMNWASAALIGPGIGTGEAARDVLAELLNAYTDLPLVIDADGINLISESKGLREKLYEKAAREPVIITPHLMEMSRLSLKRIADIKQDMQGTATQIAKTYNVTVVLKDARTVVVSPDGRAVINTTGNNGMSTAGSGDVLAGVIASFLAQGCDAFTAASIGVYIHGAAGDAAAERYGVRGMKAMDIAEALPEVLLKADSIR